MGMVPPQYCAALWDCEEVTWSDVPKDDSGYNREN